MARSRKKEPATVAQPELSKQEVVDILEFARALAGSYYPNIITPDLLNTRLKEISYTPLVATQSTLDAALANPLNSEEELRGFVENFEIISAPFRRIISYLSSMLAMNLQYTVINAEPDDYRTIKFKKDQKIVYDFLDRFDWQFYFRNVIKQVLRNEICVGWVREDSQKIIFQELPVNYCKITARWDFNFLADFNFYYFLLAGVSLDGWPDWFKERYLELFGGENGYTKYKPFMPPEARVAGGSQWAYWVSLPTQCFTFKFDPSLVAGIPYMSALMPELINQSVMRSLQKDLNLASATKILGGTIPLLKDQGAKLANALALDPKVTGQFLGLVKAALSSAIKLAAAPLEGMTAINFEGDNDMYDKWLKTSLASSGMNTSIFYSSNLKQNAFESQLSFQSDSLLMEQNLYPQFSSFFDYFVNRKLSKFRYKFSFSGNAYYLDRERTLNAANTLAANGICLPQLYAAGLGIEPQDFIRMMDESKAIGFVDKLTPIVPGFQQSATTKTNGRPQKSESDLTESGSVTREAGSNLEKGGNI